MITGNYFRLALRRPSPYEHGRSLYALVIGTMIACTFPLSTHPKPLIFLDYQINRKEQHILDEYMFSYGKHKHLLL